MRGTLHKCYGLPGPVNPLAPSITTQPQSQTVLQGQSANFTVAATGTAPLSYQWYYNTNTAISGATSASLTLSNVQPANAGSYSAVVSNSAGSVTSVVATLTVNIPVPPSISTQPQDLTVGEGDTAHFNVVATGTAAASTTRTICVTAIGSTPSRSGPGIVTGIASMTASLPAKEPVNISPTSS